MKDFHSKRPFNTGGSYGPKRFGDRGGDRGGFRPGGRGPVEMHDATCNNCGKATQVPFLPNGKKPVYCRDCFATVGGRDEARGDREPRNDRPHDHGGFKKPFEPREDHGTRTYTSQSAEMTTELKAIGAKLDRLIAILEPKPVPPKVIIADAPVKSKKRVPAKKK